jgi:hypothetical protein
MLSFYRSLNPYWTYIYDVYMGCERSQERFVALLFQTCIWGNHESDQAPGWHTRCTRDGAGDGRWGSTRDSTYPDYAVTCAVLLKDLHICECHQTWFGRIVDQGTKTKTAKLVTWRLLRELETDYTFYASFKRGGFGPYFKSVEALIANSSSRVVLFWKLFAEASTASSSCSRGPDY